uniref:L1 transposable element RRM domain-containing protein n=1 Tax=Sus scrofa TaxID=9823 RepID=A0A8D1XUV8_PIG
MQKTIMEIKKSTRSSSQQNTGGRRRNKQCGGQAEITDAEQKREERLKTNEESLRELWDNVKRTKSYIIWVPDGEEREKGTENIFQGITAENFPHMAKEPLTQIQEAQRVPYKINPRRNTPRHTLIKLTKIKDKILKAAWEKKQITYKGTP